MTKFKKTSKINKRVLIIQIAFWTLVGITSGLLYDLEWFIQHSIIFNGKLLNDLGNDPSLSGVSSIEEFYKGYNTPGPLQDYYNTNIEQAFKTEGLIFMTGALTASFISGPLLAFGVNRKKNYVLFVVPMLFLFSIVSGPIAPLLSSVFLLWVVFTPVFGICYSYRTVLDPWGATYAKNTNIRISFVRAFYELGAALAALAITQIYSQYSYHLRTSGYESGVAFYVLSFFLVVLACFILVFMPNKSLFKEKNENKTTSEKENNLVKQKTLKQTLTSRTFIVGTIIFLMLIGTTLAFNSIWVNTTENISQLQKDPKSVVQIGYMKSFSIIPRFIIAIFILKLYKKIPFKNLLIITSSLASVSWFTIGTLIYVVKVNPIISSLIGGIAEASISTFAVLLGYEFISKITTVKNRTITFLVFNTIAYGLGAVIFAGFNTFLSKTKMWQLDTHGGLIVWYIMGIAAVVALLVTLFLFKMPSDISNKKNIEKFNKKVTIS